MEAGEMARAALAMDWGSDPSTHMDPCNCL